MAPMKMKALLLPLLLAIAASSCAKKSEPRAEPAASPSAQKNSITAEAAPLKASALIFRLKPGQKTPIQISGGVPPYQVKQVEGKGTLEKAEQGYFYTATEQGLEVVRLQVTDAAGSTREVGMLMTLGASGDEDLAFGKRGAIEFPAGFKARDAILLGDRILVAGYRQIEREQSGKSKPFFAASLNCYLRSGERDELFGNQGSKELGEIEGSLSSLKLQLTAKGNILVVASGGLSAPHLHLWQVAYGNPKNTKSSGYSTYKLEAGSEFEITAIRSNFPPTDQYGSLTYVLGTLRSGRERSQIAVLKVLDEKLGDTGFVNDGFGQKGLWVVEFGTREWEKAMDLKLVQGRLQILGVAEDHQGRTQSLLSAHLETWGDPQEGYGRAGRKIIPLKEELNHAVARYSQYKPAPSGSLWDVVLVGGTGQPTQSAQVGLRGLQWQDDDHQGGFLPAFGWAPEAVAPIDARRFGCGRVGCVAITTDADLNRVLITVKNSHPMAIAGTIGLAMFNASGRLDQRFGERGVVMGVPAASPIKWLRAPGEESVLLIHEAGILKRRL